MERVWTSYLTEDDKLVIEKGGYGKSRGLGTSPMLVVIDAQYNYVGEDKPVGEQLAEWPSGGGAPAWAAIRRIRPLVEEARSAGVPVLFTTNCLMPPKASYQDRVFTTEVVSFPGLTHIGEDKDFTPLIEKAKALGGYAQEHPMTGLNGGTTVTTGFGHHAVLSVAEPVISAIKSGDLSHIFLVGGCDGARPGRNYYTEFVRQTPKDTAVLTLACGKFRFNDMDLGTVGGLPRLMDMGQCNDA